MTLLYGIGKGTVIQVPLADRSFNKLGDIQAGMPGVIAEASDFIAASYDGKKTKNSLEVCEEVWSQKMDK